MGAVALPWKEVLRGSPAREGNSHIAGGRRGGEGLMGRSSRPDGAIAIFAQL